MDKISIADKLASFDTHWDPKIIAELNGQQVRVVKFQGEFVWHSHETEDELFMVIKGRFEMKLRDRSIYVDEGELLVVPRGVEHCPCAEEEVAVLLFEPAGTLNTGDAGGERTVTEPERI
jgi:mannose-6-phosphate isomerase-like protein (cupin superfamily)